MIAVTGVTGLMGYFIVKKFLDEGHQVIGIRRNEKSVSWHPITHPDFQWRLADNIDYFALLDALEGTTCVVHAAALVSFNSKDRSEMMSTNVEGTRNIVNACLQKNINSLIHISSVAAIGRPRGASVLNEETPWNSGEINSSYAESKYLAELEVTRGQAEGLSTAIINPSVVLATGDINRSSSRIFKYVTAERPFYAEGNINYVDVRDVADMIYTIFKKEKAGQRYIANAGMVSLKYILDQMAFRMNRKAPSIKANSGLVMMAVFIDQLRSWLTGSEPMVTRESARLVRESVTFDSAKSTKELDISYRSLTSTLDWCCEYFKNLGPRP